MKAPGLLAALLAAATALADPSPAALRKTIDRLVARPDLASAFWGIEVRGLDTGRTVYALNAEKAFRPASALKIVTTAAAIDAFGPEARIRTTVETAGRLDRFGRILGDVYLVGRGDPNLSGRFDAGRRTAAFETMADVLVAAGVRRIEGRLIGHEGAFSGERRGSDWSWEDLVWSYGAEVSALSFNDNAVDLSLRPGERPGDPAFLDVSPLTPYVTVVSTVTTTATGTQEDVTLTKLPGSNRVLLSGGVPPSGGWEGRVAVEDPARYAASVFAEVLAAKGILVTGGVGTSSSTLPAGLRILAAHEGATMAEMIRVVNKESENLHAEMLLRLVGLRVKGEGSAEKGHEAIAEFLRRLRVPDGGWGLTDGSGLSRTDLVTPRGLVALLVAMDRHPHAAAFRESLAIAGVDGTLEKRMRGTAAERLVLAKTGTLRLANALAGYATTRWGERLAFAIFVNNHVGKGREAVAAIDDMTQALVAR